MHTTKCPQEMEAASDKGASGEKEWRKSFVRAVNHAAMKRVQREKCRRSGSDTEDGDAQRLECGSTASR